MGLRELYRGLSSLSPEQRALLARRLEESGRAYDEPSLVPRPRLEEPVPVSLMQQRLWLLDQIEPGNPFYNLPLLCFELDGPLDPALLARCFAVIERRHESLRTVFRYADGEPVQVVLPPPVRRLETVDLSALPAAVVREEALALARAEARRTFDLAAGPLWRTTLLRLDPEPGSGRDRHWLLITLHHIVADAWSIGVLYREITLLYGAAAAGRPAALRPLPVQFPDFALWQRARLRGALLDEEIAFWRGQLAGVPDRLELPTDRPHLPVRSYRGERQTLALPPALPEVVHRFTQGAGASLYMALLAVWGTLLHRYTGQEDFVVASPVASRNRVEIEGLIGFFVNTVLHRLRFDGDPSFRGLLARVRDVVLEVYEHQELPFDRLVEALAPRRDPRYGTFYQSMLSLQNTPTPELELADLTVRPRGIDNGTCHTDLILFAGMDGGRLGAVQIEYSTDLFDAATIENLQEHFLTLLAASAEDPERPVSALPLLAPAGRLQVLAWAGPRADARVTPDLPLHRLFELQAARAPQAAAVVHNVDQLTYGELESLANRLAHRLRGLGVGPETRVGLCLDRSLDLPIAVLGILKAGGAYVPLDPEYPAERLRFLLEDADIAVLVTRNELLGRLPEVSARLVLLDDAVALAGEMETPPEVPVGPDHLAYVIYTSGSTGRPKGAGVTHGNVVRLFTAAREAIQFSPGDVWSLFHSFAFDFSVWELWGALLHGGTVVIVPQWVARSPEALLALLATEGVTCLSQTPSAFRQLMGALEASPGGSLALRSVVFGGEALEPATLASWFALPAAAGVRLINMYGITETSVHVTWREMIAADLAQPRGRIGRPLPDLSLHLVDRHLEPVPAGVPGEIAVGGAGVCRGYLGRPDLTAARFVPDPFATAPGARLYRSGDLGRRLPDSDVEYLGRIDHQVKVRGLRIELGEIEAALVRQPGVCEAVVLAREIAGETGLVAYLTAAPGVPAFGHAELRDGLRAVLPEYMVPAVFVLLDRLPLTAHGKVDRRNLPEPERLRPNLAEEYLAPRTPTEEVLVELWKELLPVDRVGVLDDFFALGGHSLLAARLAARLRERLRLDVSAQVVFQTPTVAALAGSLDRMRALSPPSEAPALVATPRRARRGA